MAEFKLGRIRFVWKNNWLSNTIYYKDDIVRHGGNTYVCISGHTSTLEFRNDEPSYWNKISDGQEWKNDWQTNTLYKVNDIVKYGGYLYIANTEHTSASTNALGLEADQSKWDLYAEGFDYKSNWQISTRYKVNDIVKYNSTIFICIEEHTSASTNALGLEADQSKWDVFSKGLQWLGDWSINQRYRVNDIVRYGGQVYVCNEGHTSASTNALGLEADQSKWDSFYRGIEYKETWIPNVRYKVNDVVKYGGGLWICTQHHTSQINFTNNSANWSQFVEGLEFEDSWDPTIRYQAGDFITYGGYSYIAKRNNLGSNPSVNSLDWDLYTTGFRFVGDWGDDSTLQDYKVGDVVRVGGYTYLCILDNNNQKPPNTTYWERLNSGIFWKNNWTNSTIYDLGDAVRFNNNSYICILAHTSDDVVSQNRPDQDTLGTFWNLLSGGPENNVMTTQGDLVYYSGSGPARLPIGAPGQSLKVNSTRTAPEWSYIGSIDNIYYVAMSGVDLPAPIYGMTLDQPWRTIRYATEQVAKGPLKPNAKKILLINRSFIQAETVEWIDYQISNNISPFTTGFVYDKEKCRRDIGLIIDAVRYDISHGGNSKSREAAIAYFNGAISNVAGQETQTVAAINYALTVIERVLDNLDPTQNYQTLNSVPSVITQVKDITLVSEAGIFSRINELVSLITSAIIAGNTDDLPPSYKPNNTIFVKTGQFNEVLPIIIPANCAIVGDELRSTSINAVGNLISNSDVPYSISALTRFQAIISDIIQNNAITPSAGNVTSQITSRPAGNSSAGSAAASLLLDAIAYINFHINSTGSNPALIGSNTVQSSTGYTYAVEVLEANRQFILDEIESYITTTFLGYTYNINACLRDIDRYIDAIQYDLIHQSNYKTIMSAKYYTNAVQGSTLENMFLMQNGTGLRNCTVSGLNGTLGAPNLYGTRRPTAGAYVSLDPGWGPNDTSTWITTRSPYVQNVTTFGTGCVGLKVDGSLHAGGNDSIVANDFTQLVSDGIGAWCTNLARTELVSVFSYYAYIGYLAENGGKIRATNGNSSYGIYGTLSEGGDNTETPITGNVDNRHFEAIVGNVFTNGEQILVFEFDNAGVNYTVGGTTATITGEGFGATIDTLQTVDGGVFEVRLLDNNDSSEQFGGLDYLTTQNNAQDGNTTSITLSNTEFVTSSQLIGMSIFIIEGTGAGQYGYIDSYNSGTKVAIIRKHSDGLLGWDHVVPGTSIQATLNSTTGYIIEPRITFTPPLSGLYTDTTKARAVVEDGKIIKIRIWDPGNGYLTPPSMTITDPNNTIEAPFEVRIGDGVLTQPIWSNRGTAFETATVEFEGDGYADSYQPGEIIRITNLSDRPIPGCNVEFSNLPGKYYKLVFVRDLTGSGLSGIDAPYSAQLQISPALEISEAPDHNESIELRIRYSQVRLTGHDFLDVGTGNITNTNYPDDPLIDPAPNNETVEIAGGRVFYTSTDQDGNFRVGSLFSIEQATGTATLNADAFNITGLQELSLGELGLGNTGATITEFSTDGTFTANSDSIVPTQKAIKTYITSQIGSGASELNVNSVTAGQVKISGQEITTTTGNQIVVQQKMNFRNGVGGFPIAMNYYLNQ